MKTILDELTPLQFYLLLEQGLIRRGEMLIHEVSLFRLSIASILDEKAGRQYDEQMSALTAAIGIVTDREETNKILGVPIGKGKGRKKS